MSRVALLLASLALAGCLAPGESDRSAIWEIPAAPTAASQVRVKVILPSALRRPTLVTYDAGRPVNHDLDRWGTPLDEALARLVAADLDESPFNDVVVDVQRLEVDADGKVTLLFTALMSLSQGANGERLALRAQSELIEIAAKTEARAQARHELAAALEGYSMIHGAISLRIRDCLAKEQGGVAKPPATVTVPGK